ncbi:OadG family protein [bacterium]|nr:OadG family protein [candidate division CSSED10-310 bacterium]
MTDNVIQGLQLSLAGILIVYIILAFISLMVALIGYLDGDWKRREKRQKLESLEKPPTIDDLTLVLISAAVATMLKGRYRIRSVTRVKPGSGGSAWSLQGRSTLLGSHVISKGND